MVTKYAEFGIWLQFACVNRKQAELAFSVWRKTTSLKRETRAGLLTCSRFVRRLEDEGAFD